MLDLEVRRVDDDVEFLEDLYRAFGCKELSRHQSIALGGYLGVFLPHDHWFDNFKRNALVLASLCPDVESGMISLAMVNYIFVLWQFLYESDHINLLDFPSMDEYMVVLAELKYGIYSPNVYISGEEKAATLLVLLKWLGLDDLIPHYKTWQKLHVADDDTDGRIGNDGGIFYNSFPKSPLDE